jgi:biopolymer transport protein ExbD
VEQRHEELNLTPYLDVLMNLIVFMLVAGSGLVGFGAIPVQAVFGAGPAAAAPARVHSLAITPQGLVLDGETVPLGELKGRLKALKAREPASRALLVRAAADVSFERLVQVLDEARDERFDEVTLSD